MSPTYDGTEKFLAALMLWRESRGVPPSIRRDAYRAILHVALNRVGQPRWRSTLYRVILQPRQFSSFNSWESSIDARFFECDPNAVAWPNPTLPNDWKAWEEACGIVDLPGEDPTNGANHYHSLPAGKGPGWAESRTPVLVIGPFKFYRL